MLSTSRRYSISDSATILRKPSQLRACCKVRKAPVARHVEVLQHPERLRTPLRERRVVWPAYFRSSVSGYHDPFELTHSIFVMFGTLSTAPSNPCCRNIHIDYVRPYGKPDYGCPLSRSLNRMS